jgi:hypothetical protein
MTGENIGTRKKIGWGGGEMGRSLTIWQNGLKPANPILWWGQRQLSELARGKMATR